MLIAIVIIIINHNNNNCFRIDPVSLQFNCFHLAFFFCFFFIGLLDGALLCWQIHVIVLQAVLKQSAQRNKTETKQFRNILETGLKLFCLGFFLVVQTV